MVDVRGEFRLVGCKKTILYHTILVMISIFIKVTNLTIAFRFTLCNNKFCKESPCAGGSWFRFDRRCGWWLSGEATINGSVSVM